MGKLADHVFIFSTILFTVYSQLIMRWQVLLAGDLPSGHVDKIWFIGRLLLNPWVLSGIAATFFSGVSWMLTMTRFEISYAFPFASLNYVVVLAAGWLFFGESFGLLKLVGTALVISGLLVITRG